MGYFRHPSCRRRPIYVASQFTFTFLALPLVPRREPQSLTVCDENCYLLLPSLVMMIRLQLFLSLSSNIISHFVCFTFFVPSLFCRVLMYPNPFWSSHLLPFPQFSFLHARGRLTPCYSFDCPPTSHFARTLSFAP